MKSRIDALDAIEAAINAKRPNDTRVVLNDDEIECFFVNDEAELDRFAIVTFSGETVDSLLSADAAKLIERGPLQKIVKALEAML